MPSRHFPVRPNLEQLRHQAKDLLREIRAGNPDALSDLREYHPENIQPAQTKLADAQLILARSYGLPSWPRLVLSCRMTDAIWSNSVDEVRDLVLQYPNLIREKATVPRSHWGPPMSYAANLGRTEIVAILRGLGADDVQYAFERACLQGRIDTARQLRAMGARPLAGSIMGPCETLNADGLAFLLESGGELADEHGNRLAPVALILETYSRSPKTKRRCLEIIERHGISLPDTPTMAVHRGRIDLLESHLARDPRLFQRTFSHREIYPLELGCHKDESLALHGTPLAGATLLHMCVDFDEIEIACWMFNNGADPNAKAAVDADGFGGHTPLFGCVVCQAYRANCREDDQFARLLLDRGADPNVRASLRKRLRFVADESTHQYRNVTPLSWGERFHDGDWVSPAVMRLIKDRGGVA